MNGGNGYWTIILLLPIIFLFGCQTEVTKANFFSELISQSKSNVTPEQFSKTETMSIGEYTLAQLQNDIESSLEQTTLIWKKEEGTPLYSGNRQWSYVIYELPQPITRADDFYNQFSTSDWEGNKYFLPQGSLDFLQPDVKREQFADEKEYEEYLRHRSIIEQTTRETSLSMPHGNILEYQHLNWAFDRYGSWKGPLVDTLLIYKVYCSPQFVVLLRPSWDKFTLEARGAAHKSQAAYDNWETTVRSLRKKMLPLADEILNKCPVQKEFFSRVTYHDFEKKKIFYYYLPLALKNWNFFTTIETEKRPAKEFGGNLVRDKYTIEKITYTFINKGVVDIESPILIDIFLISDEKEGDYFITGKKIGESIKKNQVISDTIYSLTRQEFAHNLTIKVTPFIFASVGKKTPISPTEYLLFANGTLVRRRE